MKPIILSIIKRIHNREKVNNIHPDYVTMTEIRIEILSMTEYELSNLVNKGTLSTGPTKDSEYFKIK